MDGTFDFSHALKLLWQGYRLTRVNRCAPWFEIRLDQSTPSCPVLLEKAKDGKEHPWLVSSGAVLANDWMVVKDGE